MMLERLPLPAPASVRPKPPPTMVPLLVKLSVPASDWMDAAAPRVSKPPKLLVPLRLRSAPLALTPVPLIVRASAPTEMLPCNSSEPPLATVVPAAVVPRALLLAMLSRPAVTVVADV